MTVVGSVRTEGGEGVVRMEDRFDPALTTSGRPSPNPPGSRDGSASTRARRAWARSFSSSSTEAPGRAPRGWTCASRPSGWW